MMRIETEKKKGYERKWVLIHFDLEGSGYSIDSFQRMGRREMREEA